MTFYESLSALGEATFAKVRVAAPHMLHALASLILVSGESGAATKFAGYALYSLMQEHRDFVVDAIETHCKNEPAWGRVLLLALHLTSPDVCTLCR